MKGNVHLSRYIAKRTNNCRKLFEKLLDGKMEIRKIAGMKYGFIKMSVIRKFNFFNQTMKEKISKEMGS